MANPLDLLTFARDAYQRTKQPLKERGTVLPIGEYEDGSVGFAWPGLLAAPAQAWGRMVDQSFSPDLSENDLVQMSRDSFDAAGLAMTGGLTAAGAGLVDNAAGAFGGRLKPFVDDAAQGFKLTDELVAKVKTPRKDVQTNALYHSGTAAEAEAIKSGLEPRHGPWIRETLEGATDDPSLIDKILETSPELSWLSDQPDWVLAKVRRATGKSDVTLDDVRKHGHLSVFFPDEYDDVFRVGADGLNEPSDLVRRPTGEEVKFWDTPLYRTDDTGSSWAQPFGVEKNEWITSDVMTPDGTLTGDELIRFLDQLTPDWRNNVSANAKSGSAVPLAMQTERQAPQGIRAYHGSPHDFDQFSLDKIGTGEGAQAYGHGLYFADSEDVARNYRDALAGSGKIEARAQGGKTKNLDSGKIVSKLSQKYGDELGDEVNEYLRMIGTGELSLDDAKRHWMGEATRSSFGRDVYTKLFRDAVGVKNTGRMYEVNIRANPEDFLDWDKPLADQPEAVREAFSRAALPGTSEDDALMRDLFGPDAGASILGLFDKSTGAQAYNTFRSRLDNDAATRALREAGIPGIRYLDGMSRDGGTGTSNYVVFDDQLIDILRKYANAKTGSAVPLGMEANQDDGEAALMEVLRQYGLIQ